MSIKRFYIQMIIMAACALLASCGHRGQEDANTWKVYFPKADYSSINSEERRIVPEDNTDTAGMLIRALSEQPSDADGVPALPESIRPLGYSLSERHVDIDFPAAYLDMEKTSFAQCLSELVVIRVERLFGHLEYFSYQRKAVAVNTR